MPPLSHTERRRTREILHHYKLADSDVHKIKTGNINASYLVQTASGDKYVLQCLNPMFPASINCNLEIVTRHLKTSGLVTPELIYTKTQQGWVEAAGEIWRLLSYIDGDTHTHLVRAEMAKETGGLLGRFHVALFSLECESADSRIVHKLSRHLDTLSTSLVNKADHPDYKKIARLADEIQEAARSLPTLPKTAHRLVHGDPKITNVLFERASNKALCFVDLDTIAKMPLYLELGDAMRSWCNPNGEDTDQGLFSLEFFAAIVHAYAAETRDHINEPEWSNIVPATQTICIELAARFCADALNENYFAWDPGQFQSHSEHNRVRAMGQLNVARSLSDQYQSACDIVKSAFYNKGKGQR